jgi:phosphatidate phosphatase APP1
MKKTLRWLKYRFKQSLGWDDRPVLQVYRGFGNREAFTLQGHLAEQKGLQKPEPEQSPWQNALAMLKRYLSGAIPGKKILARYGSAVQSCVSDENGAFSVTFVTGDPPEDGWVEVSFWLAHDPEVQATCTAWIDRGQARFGTISDMDDTVIVSHATKLWRKLWLMLRRNALTRLPFEGVSDFYQALVRRPGQPDNPLFFVSSSEWNLHDLLLDFVRHHQIPEGIFLLQDLKSLRSFWQSGGGTHDHKAQKIERILETVTELPFVLIGDSGQHDPELYDRLARRYPDRIVAIYIRDLSGRRRSKAVRLLGARLYADTGIEMLGCPTTRAAFDHARKHGLVGEEGPVKRAVAPR